MDMLKTGWNFFQNEVVGMAWLNRLIGNLNRLKQVGRIGMIEQVGGRTVVIIKAVPKVEGQSRQSYAAAGLPALG